MAAAIPEILSVDAHFVSHLGRQEYPRLALSLLFPCRWCPSFNPCPHHLTVGGETSSLVAEQKIGSTTTCVMTQLVLLWVSVFGFYCNFTVKLWFYQRE